MRKLMFLVPIVFFITMTFFLVYYSASIAPVDAPTQIHMEKVTEPTSIPQTLIPYPELQDVININKATIEQLQQLPGIGLKKAETIAEYVRINGPLTSVDDLLNVKGIGEKTLDALRPYITAIS